VAERLVLGERTVCEVGAVAITEGDRTSGAAAPSFRADRRLCTADDRFNSRAGCAQIDLFWRRQSDRPPSRRMTPPGYVIEITVQSN